MPHPGDDQPIYRRMPMYIRVSGLLLVLLLVVAMVLPVVLQQLIVREPPSKIEVVVDNQTHAAYIVWGSTDPKRVPSDEYLLARYGFEVGAHSVAVLPRDRSWVVVEVWTKDCDVITEDAAPVDSGRVVIRPDGTVTTIEGKSGQDQLLARPTNACALQPYMPSTVPDDQ
jgi:hypothetical protein